jgi:uncharacterized protein YeaO (DUF488 family)
MTDLREFCGMDILTGLRTDCYAAVIGKFRRNYPKAHFECVMRYPPSVHLNMAPGILSPSPALLMSGKKGQISFTEYGEKLYRELFTNPQAIRRMKELKVLAKSQLVFLVCVEKDASQCHRSLLKNWIEQLQESE